jgi:hypothetical protein
VTQYTLGLTRLLGHGRAFSEVVTVPKPPVSSGFTYTVSSYWEVSDSLSFRLVTDVNAANRSLLVSILDGSGVLLAAFAPNTVQIASLTRDYVFMPNQNASTGPFNGVYLSPWYEGMLQPGFSIVLTIAAKTAGDQVSNIRLNQERFVTGEEGYLLGVYEEDDPRLTAAVAASALLA